MGVQPVDRLTEKGSAPDSIIQQLGMANRWCVVPSSNSLARADVTQRARHHCLFDTALSRAGSDTQRLREQIYRSLPAVSAIVSGAADRRSIGSCGDNRAPRPGGSSVYYGRINQHQRRPLFAAIVGSFALSAAWPQAQHRFAENPALFLRSQKLKVFAGRVDLLRKAAIVGGRKIGAGRERWASPGIVAGSFRARRESASVRRLSLPPVGSS